jgi:hypothetical protein
MLQLEGIHGTTVSRTKKIGKTGFLSAKGRAGSGIYFWRVGTYSRDLAVGWWRFQSEKGCYGGDNDTRCAMICVLLLVEDNEYLDLENPELKEQLAELTRQKKPQSGTASRAALYDLFIRMLEQKLKLKFRVIGVRVTPPPSRHCSYPEAILGWPFCFMVRDGACITIQRIEECGK